MNFKESLDNHLSSISARNLEEFSRTLVKDDRLTLIMPNSSVLNGYEAIVDFHKNWFSDPDWSIETTLLKTIESNASCIALLDVVYNDLDESGEPYQLNYILSLTFVFEGGSWLLTFDQNTMRS
ncbi:nuclear transport factor 2 family protein [Gynuella sp.]|uniref:nuclear transport factor 2 family protein n=1 Tax=Gynuella sp. TaxID=2969146 RepID=UPI003D0BDEDD